MLYLGLRKPRANNLEMQIIENTGDPSFHNAFPPALPRSLPASGHSILQVRVSLRREGCGRTAAPPHPRREAPKAIQTSFRRLAIPQFASGGQGDLKPSRLACKCVIRT